ncbi:hypothetical protein DSCO28_34960 [Desulfosarcina ovata subsp. sediminis]|uniref:Uncharacterized protein n=1 Tax=Desulfosarcina ovata subsp. sediminis TaxID=885957 RepID=A0A5K7ZR84_9BACT|nr:hypothetical protein [Desulfosarcina ovata]BBO82930.1 hypothetical protein DSCO28_34960 [Desulfosarcina ovata subsp. sediminis]
MIGSGGQDTSRSHALAGVFPHLAGEMERIKTAIRERQVISSPKVQRRAEQETRFEDITIFPLTANGVEGAVIRGAGSHRLQHEETLNDADGLTMSIPA